MKTQISFAFLLFCFVFSFSQNRKIDSLRVVISALPEDTPKVNKLLNMSGRFYRRNDFDSSKVYALKALNVSKKIGFRSGLANAHNAMGSYYLAIGNYADALKENLTSLQIQTEIGDAFSIAACHNNIGNVYFNQGNYPEALNSHLQALKIRTELNDSLTIAYSNVNIGNIHGLQGNFKLALKYYLTSLDVLKSSKETLYLTAINSNIGQSYQALGDFKQAEKYFNNCLDLAKRSGKRLDLALSYISLGSIYQLTNRHQEALEKSFAALKLAQEIGSKQYEIVALYTIGMIYGSKKKYKDSEKYLLESYLLSKEIGDVQSIMDAGLQLSELYKKVNKHALALAYFKIHIDARDTLYNVQNAEKATRLSMNYEFEKKNTAARLEQEKRDALSLEEGKKQRIIIYSISGILFLVICFAIYALRSNRQKQKANHEISKQKAVIEEKQKEIIDSIHYAKRIQNAHLPSQVYLLQNLKRLKDKAN